MIKVGRRERSEPFLNISEIYVPRFLPRESLDNIAQAMRFVHVEQDGYKAFNNFGGNKNFDSANSITNAKSSNSGTHNMRAFLVRRPVGTVSKTWLDEELAKCVLKSTTARTILNRGRYF